MLLKVGLDDPYLQGERFPLPRFPVEMENGKKSHDDERVVAKDAAANRRETENHHRHGGMLLYDEKEVVDQKRW